MPATIAPGQVLYRTDDVANNYWGSDINWSPGGSGWVMIIDNQGKVMDFAAWGYTQAEINSLQLTVGGHAIGGTMPIPVADYFYEGDAAIAHGISATYPDLNGTLLTDGNLGTTDWRTGYAGSQEPNSQGERVGAFSRGSPSTWEPSPTSVRLPSPIWPTSLPASMLRSGHGIFQHQRAGWHL